ncbi:hypothetical protein MtrunA17_Chr2g0323851 [Medicago truncatula]|uniref:Uncharacterized protein n=1 Tax=Medicago truncatula TaxID=3880 RepID=A0A396JH55_MEDTR|nr:hypothetical protein MtrunA17_Chr2g0323851 [Medicago truncatula]
MSRYSKTETYQYQIPIFHGCSLICINEVSKLIILIFNKYFIGYLCDTPHIHNDISKILHIYVS